MDEKQAFDEGEVRGYHGLNTATALYLLVFIFYRLI